MKLLGFTLLLAQAIGGEDFYQDFRKGYDPAVFRLDGRNAAEWIKPEAEGVRITLPPGCNVPGAVGLTLREPIHGDFEITTGYEIVQVGVPTAGFGAGFAIYLRTNTPTRETVEFFHIVRPSGSEVYACARITTLDGRRATPPNVDVTDQPVPGKAGQLRITRVGAQAFLSAAGPDSSDFKRLYQFELGNEEVAVLRVGLHAGNAPNPVDVRLRDFRMRFKGVAAPPGTVPEANRAFHLFLIFVLAATINLAGLLIWLYRRRAEKREASRAA